VWACPSCSSKILQHRALEIGAVLAQALEQGHALGFFTFTMRHRRSQPLALLWGAGQKGWQRVISGKQWVRQSADAGLEGSVRVWETTDGPNGWHVHVHGVLVLRKGAQPADLDALALGMFGRWSKGLQAAGLEAPWRRGQEWHLVSGAEAADDLAGYLCKIAGGLEEKALGLGLELTHTRPGRSREGLGTQPVWSILERLVLTGEADALERWHEWERVSKGKRQVGWSNGLRQRFAPDLEELDDDQVADQEMGSSDDDLVRFDHEGWRLIVARPSLPVAILEHTERGGLPLVRSLLAAEGIPHQLVRA